MSHWTKPDHVTFLIALVFAFANLFLNMKELNAAVVLFLLIALVYDLREHRNKK
jgi:hypothetical protein